MQRAHKTGSGNNFEYLTMKRVSYETNQFFLMLVMNWENSCVRLLVVPLCFIALHDKFEPKDVYRWLCFDACKATVLFAATLITKSVAFLAQKVGKLWKKYLEKTIVKNSWISGLIKTIQTTKHTELNQTITAINSIQMAHINKNITQKDVIKRLNMWNGHQIILSGMIENIWKFISCQCALGCSLSKSKICSRNWKKRIDNK